VYNLSIYKTSIKDKDMKKLRRMNEHAMLGGVCSGIAYYLGIETWLVRLIYQ
jgi:phage shock protein PspC (stress-responsive transcriptional regulator)